MSWRTEVRRRLWRRPGRTVAAGLVASCGVVVLAGGWLAPQATAVAITAMGRFLEFYAGVFALVTLTLSVLIGLAATDRLVLTARQRVRAQTVHRALAVSALAGLAVHLTATFIDMRVGPIDVVLPFRTPEGAVDQPPALALGAVACLLMLAITASGFARGRFAVAERAWLWRLLHGAAYVAWPLAIAHGLTAGRTPAWWVTLMYGLCLGAVAIALPARFLIGGRSRRAR